MKTYRPNENATVFEHIQDQIEKRIKKIEEVTKRRNSKWVMHKHRIKSLFSTRTSPRIAPKFSQRAEE